MSGIIGKFVHVDGNGAVGEIVAVDLQRWDRDAVLLVQEPDGALAMIYSSVVRVCRQQADWTPATEICEVPGCVRAAEVYLRSTWMFCNAPGCMMIARRRHPDDPHGEDGDRPPRWCSKHVPPVTPPLGVESEEE